MILATDDAPAWEVLASGLRPYVRARVRTAADADDVLQDVLLRVHRGIGKLERAEKFRGWMYAIARSAIADHLRARQRHPVAESTPATEGTHDPFADPGDAVAQEVAAYLAAFVSLLPTPYREAITLTELEGRTQREAAEMLGVSLSTMKSRVQRGRARLRHMLEACCEIALDARGRLVECEPKRLEQIPDDCC